MVTAWGTNQAGWVTIIYINIVRFLNRWLTSFVVVVYFVGGGRQDKRGGGAGEGDDGGEGRRFAVFHFGYPC